MTVFVVVVVVLFLCVNHFRHHIDNTPVWKMSRAITCVLISLLISALPVYSTFLTLHLILLHSISPYYDVSVRLDIKINYLYIHVHELSPIYLKI